jgi:hypothetical protein
MPRSWPRLRRRTWPPPARSSGWRPPGSPAGAWRRPGPGGEAGARPQDITDPATGLSRLLSERCSTCILRHGDKMHLGAEHTARFVRQALDAGTYVVCHQTLTYGDHPDFGSAICRGFFDAYANPRELHQMGAVCRV